MKISMPMAITETRTSQQGALNREHKEADGVISSSHEVARLEPGGAAGMAAAVVDMDKEAAKGAAEGHSPPFEVASPCKGQCVALR